MAVNYSIVIVLITSAVVVSNALQCFQCGQYNDGVGSITPCLNYSDHLAHLHLKDCTRSSDKYCIVSIAKYNQQQKKNCNCLLSIIYSVRSYNNSIVENGYA